MRTVINKLITEEDLYGAVDAAFSQGWRRVKLYFLIGLPTELDEDVLGIAELGARCVEIGRQLPQGGDGGRLRRRVRARAHTPFQWFGQDTVAELERKVALLRGEARRTRGLTIRWHEPAASVAEGLASRGDRRMGAVIERVWRAGGTFQEWSERFDLALWEAALAAEGLSVEEVCHRTAARTRLCPGTTSPLGCTGTSCGATGRTRWRASPSRTAAGPPATTVAPAPGSGSSTWWRRRSRRRAGARAPGRTSASGDRIPVRLVSRVPEDQRRLRLRFTKAGKVRFTSHRDVARMWSGRCGAAGCRWPTPRASCLTRWSASAWPCRPGASRRGEYLDLRLEPAGPGEIPLPSCPRPLAPCCPRGSPSRRRP